MQAFAVSYGFASALKEETASLPPTEDAELVAAITEDAALIKGRNKNALAMSYLVHALRGPTLMRFIMGCQTPEWPSGKAHVLMKKLRNKYAPEDMTTALEVKAALKKVSFGKPSEDPDKMFEKLAKIQNDCTMAKIDIDWNDMIATVIDIMPDKYQMLLVKYATKKGHTQDTYEEMEAAVTQYYRQTNKVKEDTEDTEVSLMQSSGFKGRCFTCKKHGHKASECRSGNRNSQDGQGAQGQRSQGAKTTCRHCGKKGHVESGCWLKNPSQQPEWFKKRQAKKEGNEASASQTDGPNIEVLVCSTDKLTFPPSMKLLEDPNVFVADSGASTHSTGHPSGLFETVQAAEGQHVMNANGKTEKTMSVGKLKGTFCDKFGNKVVDIVLDGVNYVPNQAMNLFSLTKAMKNGWTLHGSEDEISIEKGDLKIVFDLKIPTAKGYLVAGYIKRHVEAAATTVQTKVKMTAMAAHERLGHINENETRKIAKALGWELKPGEMGVCESCTIAKAKQKNVVKASKHVPAEKPNERIYLDIATIKKPEGSFPMSTNNVWRIMVDECTQMKITDFFPSKSGMVEPTCAKLNKWKQAGMPVKYIRMDNAGENKKLKERADSSDWKLGINFEFTARDTPQHNHLAELAFATLGNRGRAIMHKANVPLKWRYRLFPEAFKTVSLLDGLVPVMVNGKLATRFEHWGGSNPQFAKHLRTWGEAGTVKTRDKMTPKLSDRGVQCMFVGYALEHSGDCYRMWDPETNGIHESRDVIWLKRMYFKPTVTPAIETPAEIIFDEETPTAVEAGEGTRNEEQDTVDTPTDNKQGGGNAAANTTGNATTMVTTRSGRVVRPNPRYDGSALNYEIKLTEAEQAYFQAMQQYPEEYPFEVALVGAGIGGGFTNTNELHVMKYDEAIASADKEAFEKAIDEEYERMVKHKVFKAVPRESVPEGEKIIDSTWAIKKKSNGTYRARMTARGFKQVDGVHYREDNKSSPVVSDITIRIVFVLAIMAKMYMEVLDVKGAFLHGEFEDGERIYMEIPQGFEKHFPRNYVWLLLMTLYGLKQAAIAFWRKLVLMLTNIRFKRSKADPCLFFKWGPNGLTMITSVIDDMNIVGAKEDVLNAKEDIKRFFECDEVGETKEYVGLKLEYEPEQGYMKITQPVLLQSLDDEFEVPKGDPVATPGVPGEFLRSEEVNATATQQRIYRSGVGKLMHLAKWSRAEAANAVRELSKFAGTASWNHINAMYRVMRYMLDTPKRGLLLKPTGTWNGDPNYEFTILGRSDADWAKDPDTRRSVSGYKTFLEGAPVAYKCAGQRFVTNSSAESELGAATACAQDMLFVMRVLESMGLKVKLPMILEVDNKGAIDWVNSWTVGGRMRHIDVRHAFLRDLREDGLIEVKWISGLENSSDILTKNLPGPAFEKHAQALCGCDEYMQYVQDGANVRD